MQSLNINHYLNVTLFSIIFFISNNCQAGIDIYAGPLSRYYTGKWENLSKQYAKTHGMEYKVVRPNAQKVEGERAKDEDLLEATISWKNNLIKILAKYGCNIKDWTESFDAPYDTKNIFFLKLFDYIDQYEKETNNKLSQLTFEYWIPYNKNVEFEGGDIVNQDILIGTSQGIIEEIDKLSRHFFKKPIENLILEYNQIKDLKNERDQFKAQLVEIYYIADWSLKNNFPMKLDY